MSTNKYTGRAANYAKYRPGYPHEIIGLLEREIDLDQTKDIADIGSGTGKLSKLFLENENLVYGVEPNTEMRETAEKLLKNNINFISINGTAEFTALADHCVDMIISGHAFHWFDTDKAKNEIRRIIRKDGYVVLIWNVRKRENPPVMADYEKLLVNFCPGYNPEKSSTVDEKIFNKFYGVKNFKLAMFRNSQLLDFTGLKGRLLSSEYVPIDTKDNKEILGKLKEIFDKRSKDGFIKFEYDTKIYYGKIKK